MIWIWIMAALILSCLPLINKKIDLANYMWLLIPIDAYGLSVAGAIIKPYMIFALLLPVIFYARNKGNEFDLSATKGQLLAGVLSALIILVNVINCGDFSAVKAAVMAFVVYVCAQFYTSCSKSDKFEQLSDVFIASAFGCGIIYIIAYICLQRGFDIDGIIALERAQDGMFMQMSNMSNGQYIRTYRLRGFAYDPNTMFLPFIFAISACVSRLFKKFNFYYVITIAVSVFCMLLSSSRMGLLCCAASIVISACVGLGQLDSVKKKITTFISVLAVCIAGLTAMMSRFSQSYFASLLSTYTNRSSLTDEYGRFSIWKECLSIYWEKSPLWGVGLGNMSTMTTTERMTHNTWLQLVCECGIIVGGCVVLYFFCVMVYGWTKVRSKHLQDADNTAYLSVVIGFTVTIIALTSVDNITCSYLWFGALLLLKMLSCYTPCVDEPPTR